MAAAHAALPAVGKELIVVANGAYAKIGDALATYTRARQLNLKRAGKLDVTLIHAAAIAELADEAIMDFGTGLETLPHDMRSDVDVGVGQDPRHGTPELRRRVSGQTLNRPDADLVIDAAPPGMYDRESPARRHRDNGDAVGEVELRGDVGAPNRHGVVLDKPRILLGSGKKLLGLIRACELEHLASVNLNRNDAGNAVETQGLEKNAAIRQNAGQIVVNVRAEVKGLVRPRAHAAVSFGEGDTYAADLEKGWIGIGRNGRKTTLAQPRQRQFEGRFRCSWEIQ